MIQIKQLANGLYEVSLGGEIIAIETSYYDALETAHFHPSFEGVL